MGRLIDADKLRAQFPEPADWLDINQTLVHKTGIWAEIDAAETVEAIPVDWIKEYIDTAEEMEGFAAKFGNAARRQKRDEKAVQLGVHSSVAICRFNPCCSD